jgi:cytochrome P450
MSNRPLPPGPRNWSPLANLGAFRRDFLGLIMDMRATYGDTVYFRLGLRDIFLISDPNAIRDILVKDNKNFIKSRGLQMLGRRLLGKGLLTSEGNLHRRQRKLIQPAFHKMRIDNYGEAMVDCTQRRSETWVDDAPIDMDEEMMKTALAIAAKTMFGAEVDEEADEISDAMTEAMNIFDQLANPLMAITEKLPLPRNKRVQQARERIDRVVYRMIAQRRKENEDRGDVLSLLLRAQDEDDGSVMTDQQVRDEAITLFLAGHETTANAMTWTWYLLSQHPEVVAKLQQEVDSVLEGRAPTLEDVPRLPYTRQVFAEGMRLYPPAHSFGRQPLEDYQLGDYVFPAGSTIIISPYVMHRHPQYWENPEAFDPERWRPEVAEQRPKMVYIPFGGGPRVCIGEPFAWLEGILVIATIARNWNFSLANGHQVVPQPLVTLRPRYGMKMIAHRRGKAGSGKREVAA